MIHKLKNLSLGKKIYSSLWVLWVAILFILIGMLTGLNKTMGEKNLPKDGWTTSLNKTKLKTLTLNEDTTFLGKHNWHDNYFVKDVEVTSKWLQTISAGDESNLVKLKKAILSHASITNQLADVTFESHLNDIKNAVLNLTISVVRGGKNVDVPNKIAIEAMYALIYSDLYTKYKDLKIAKLDEAFRTKYDASVAKLETTSLHPLVLQDKVVSRDVLELVEFKKEATKDAKKAQNVVAIVGFLFLTTTIMTILTTVIVTVKEKKGVK